MKLPTPSELSKDKGVVGRILKKLPPAVLRNADWQPDPWLFLAKYASRQKWPQSYAKFFGAARSHAKAAVRLGEIPRRGGSITASWWSKMRHALRQGDKKLVRRTMRKVVGSICRSHRGRQWLMEGKNFPPGFREQARRVYTELYDKDVRKLGREKADAKWKSDAVFGFKRETGCDKIAVALVQGWLRTNSDGAPGFCFCSDAVTAKILSRVLNLPVSAGLAKKIQGRLGLKKATIFYVLKSGKVALLK